ncbi:hypothetical protein VTI74DRAFT_7760 [Chaetomium olivicolor]
MTAVGPLTTTFRAPSSCTTTTPQLYQIWSGTASSYVEGPLFTSDSDCFPSGYDPAPTNYYSPGWCPYGYTAACSSLSPARTETETAVICCPTYLSYTCQAGLLQQPTVACTTSWSGALGVLGVTVVRGGKVGSATLVSETANTITAYGIQVRFKSGDPTPGPTTDNLSLTTRTSPALSIPTELLVPAHIASPSSSSNSGVSTPAAIGIGVGSAVAALLIAGAIGLFCFLRQRRRRKTRSPDHHQLQEKETVQQQQQHESSDSTPPSVPPKELSTSPFPSSHYRSGSKAEVASALYELPEETSPRPPSMAALLVSTRHMSMSPSFGGGRRTPGGAAAGGYSDAVELDASEATSVSLRDRASPNESEASMWTERQARGGIVTTPWI